MLVKMCHEWFILEINSNVMAVNKDKDYNQDLIYILEINYHFKYKILIKRRIDYNYFFCCISTN